ncbi:MAG: hypothetical protein GY702_06865 [Desulfobulbaceae bacterium]|nr:hypothetical protein [Desulfobulbaceae bacterium]
MLSDALTIAHTDVTITVNEVYGVDSDPLESINVYLFTESGAYQGQNAQTDASGQVVFSLPDKAYKVRADYLGGQHWSDVFTSVDTSVDIDHGYANIHVTNTGTDVDGAPVYLFTQTGSYLGRVQSTDTGGLTSFLIPAGAYKFRVDYSGAQYWSDVVNILASEETAVDLALDLLAMDGTRNPHPVRFDGTPPRREPVMLASLMDITGILNQSVVAATGPDALYWFINDHLGTPQKVIDGGQAVVWEGSQEPFGSTMVTTNTLGNNFRFPGQYFDTESGLHYNYHRYYDLSIGRYITPDPIGLAGGRNLFAYANLNPTNLIDPYGLEVGAFLGTMTPAQSDIDAELRAINRATDLSVINKLEQRAFASESYDPYSHEKAAWNWGRYVDDPGVAKYMRGASEFLYQFPKYTLEDLKSRIMYGTPGKYQPWSIDGTGGINDSLQDIRNTVHGAQNIPLFFPDKTSYPESKECK